MLQEILKECELAEEYLQAMKKTMLNDKGDCDNVLIHITNIKNKVNALPIVSIVKQSEQLVCECGNKLTDKEVYFGQCLQCDRNVEE